ELVARAKALGYRALAITDHDGIHGAMAFALACRGAEIQPITGVELTLSEGLVAKELGPVHLTLLAESQAGYTSLCTLISQAHKGIRPWEHKEPWRTRGPGQLDGRRAPDSGEVLPADVDPSFLYGRTAGLIA